MKAKPYKNNTRRGKPWARIPDEHTNQLKNMLGNQIKRTIHCNTMKFISGMQGWFSI
jgi:hypothetical protein